MEICAPKDGFVTVVSVTEQQQVNLRAPLLQMDTDEEDKAVARMEAMEAIRQLRAEQYKGPQLDALKTLAKIAVDLAQEKVKTTSTTAAHTAKLNRIGVETPANKDAAQSQLDTAKLELARASTQQEQLDYAIKRHYEIDALAKKLNQDQLDLLKSRRDRMKVGAPISGTVVGVRVAPGSFAELGSVLLEIK